MLRRSIFMAPEGAATGSAGEGSTGSGTTGAAGTGDGQGTGAAGTGQAAGAAGTAATGAAAGAAASGSTTTTGQGNGTAGGAQAQSTTPPEIKVTVPEGVTVDQALLDGFSAFLKGPVTQETAQKMVDQFVAQMAKGEANARARLAEQIVTWGEEAKADKDIGGANFQANLDLSKKTMARFGSTDLVKFMNETGLGNHKEMIRFFSTVGKLISEDRLPGGASGQGGGAAPVDPLKALYPSMFKDNQ